MIDSEINIFPNSSQWDVREGLLKVWGIFFPLCLKRKPMEVFLFLLVDMKRKIDPAATSSHYSIAMKETRLKMKLTCSAEESAQNS